MVKDECRRLKEEVVPDRFICTKQHRELTDDELDNCEYKKCPLFEEMKSCPNCVHSKSIVYETGTIDCIDYYCLLQNNKLIYSDVSPMIIHYADFPQCNINQFESIK